MTERADALHVKLAEKLRIMLDLAPVGRKSTIHHLFGILYADELGGLKFHELKYIAVLGGSAASMAVEISKGRNLAAYVKVKPDLRQYRNWP